MYIVNVFVTSTKVFLLLNSYLAKTKVADEDKKCIWIPLRMKFKYILALKINKMQFFDISHQIRRTLLCFSVFISSLTFLCHSKCAWNRIYLKIEIMKMSLTKKYRNTAAAAYEVTNKKRKNKMIAARHFLTVFQFRQSNI